MDQAIQERLQVYEREGLASPEIVQFVHDSLTWLEEQTHQNCTEERAGFFASHLMLALARISHGEELGENWDEMVREEAERLPALQPFARHIEQEASRRLHLRIPPEEHDYIVIHLGAFLLSGGDQHIAPLGS